MRLKRMGVLAAGLAFAGGTAGLGVAVAGAQTPQAAHHVTKVVKMSTSNGRSPSSLGAINAVPAAAGTAASKSKPPSTHKCPNMGSSSASSGSSATTTGAVTY